MIDLDLKQLELAKRYIHEIHDKVLQAIASSAHEAPAELKHLALAAAINQALFLASWDAARASGISPEAWARAVRISLEYVEDMLKTKKAKAESHN